MTTIGYKINEYLLLSRILESELRRQNVIYESLDITKDLKNIIGEYQSETLGEIKFRILDPWNKPIFSKELVESGIKLPKLSIETLIQCLKKEYFNFTEDDFSMYHQQSIDALLNSEFSESYLQIYGVEYKIKGRNVLYITRLYFNECVIGVDLFELSTSNTDKFSLKNLNLAVNDIATKLQNLGILLRDEGFDLLKVDYKSNFFYILINI